MSPTGNKQGAEVRGQGSGINLDLCPGPRILDPAQGLTLVEILLAVVVLSVGIAGVLQAYAVSVKTLEITQDHIDAVGLLKEKMADIEQSAIEENGLSAGASSGEFTGAFRDCTWESEAKSASVESLYELDLRVQLFDKDKKFSLATYVQNKDYERKN